MKRPLVVLAVVLLSSCSSSKTVDKREDGKCDVRSAGRVLGVKVQSRNFLGVDCEGWQ